MLSKIIQNESEEDFYDLETKKSLSNYSRTTKNFCSPFPEYENLLGVKISKKTNRGRKEIFSLPNNILKCQICLEYTDFSKEPLIFCNICKCHFHRCCYSQYEIISSISPNSNPVYKCIRCIQAEKLNKNINDKHFNCFICGHSDKTLNYNPLNRIYYHKICFLFLSELNTNLTWEQVNKEKIRKWRYKNSCKYCGEKLSKSVAVIKCKKPKCKDYYHVPCSIEKGMIFDLNFMKQYYNVSTYEQIPFYCSNHNKKIANCYKNYIIYKIKDKEINEKNLEKNEEIKTFLNNEESEESLDLKKFENGEIDEKEQNDNTQDFFDDNVSMCSSDEDMKVEECEEVSNEGDFNVQNIEEEKETEENYRCTDLNGSFFDDVFQIDINTELKKLIKMNDGDFLSELQTGNIYNQNSNNIDQFCFNKKSGFIRQNSYNF